MKYFCAQVLAGAILINERNSQAIIVNCVEVYGRTQSVDAHREAFGLKKGVPIKTSLPNENSRYPNLIHYNEWWRWHQTSYWNKNL